MGGGVGDVVVHSIVGGGVVVGGWGGDVVVGEEVGPSVAWEGDGDGESVAGGEG